MQRDEAGQSNSPLSSQGFRRKGLSIAAYLSTHFIKSQTKKL